MPCWCRNEEREGNGEDVVKEFRFKQAVLGTLMDPSNQHMLRSTIVIYQRIRQHQASYIRDSGDAKKSFGYIVIWSDTARWLSRMVFYVLSGRVSDLVH